MVLRDVVMDVYANIRRRKAGENIEAGDGLKVTNDLTVMKSDNASCSGNVFGGVADDSVSSGNWLGVATAPTEVYASADSAIAAGKYIVPAANGKVSQADTAGGIGNVIIIGYAISPSSNNVVQMKLIDSPANLSS